LPRRSTAKRTICSNSPRYSPFPMLRPFFLHNRTNKVQCQQCAWGVVCYPNGQHGGRVTALPDKSPADPELPVLSESLLSHVIAICPWDLPSNSREYSRALHFWTSGGCSRI
jgi:hypothetical protein